MKKILEEDFLRVCLKGNEFSAPVVNASSPEGFVPEMDETKKFMARLHKSVFKIRLNLRNEKLFNMNSPSKMLEQVSYYRRGYRKGTDMCWQRCTSFVG